ncbi:MAG: MBL fold metallo-hydrolase [Ardenticatenia bacterium]|nr:MBL fold metallo-hydrolase [Ardenticatenia bacterium]
MGDRFLVRFWGVRGSYPVPGPHTVRVGGNTPCVEVEAGDHIILFDGGTGIIPAGRAMIQRHQEQGRPLSAVILFSHTHHDHIQGMPYFAPAYAATATLYLFGPRAVREQVSEALRRAMVPPNFPISVEDLRAVRVVRSLAETEGIWLFPGQLDPEVRNVFRDPPDGSEDGVVRIDVLKSYAHPQEGVYLYRVSYRGHTLVYATDTEGYQGGDQRLIRFAQNADLLIHDAQYTLEEYLDPVVSKQGWGHSTPEMALEVALAAGVRRLAFFHHDPDHSDALLLDIEARAQAQFPGAMMAREGLELDLFT